MTATEVSEYLHLCRKTVYHLAKYGTIPSTRVGNNLRFYRSEVDQFMKRLSNPAKHVMVVDDAPAVCSTIKRILEEKGYIVMTVTNGQDCLNILEDIKFDKLFVDLNFDDMTGLNLVQQIRLIDKNVPITIITGYPKSDMIKELVQYGVTRIIAKPFDVHDIINDAGA